MMKISIKREQSQAGLSFAESEKFRPQVKNKLFLLLALLLTAATGAWAQDAVAIITTVRSWDFTKGGRNTDWASAQEAATSVWGGPDSSFRYSNANNLSEEELTDGTNPLKGLAGIYFTAPAGSLLLGGKDSSSKCLQTSSDGVSILLVGCAAKDRITIRFCASVKNTTVTITSDQMKSSYVANSTDRSNEVSAFVKENGNVVLNVPSKVRIYEIKVEPYVALTNFNLSAETVTVAENKTVTVTATGFSPSNAFDKTLEWTTADENVATVANGVITGVNPGTTTITVTSVDGPSKTIGVTVLPTYSVTLAEGTVDAKNWTISPASAAENETVTLQYTGRLKVKGVKATSEAAAEASVPDGAINGKFSVSDGKQVYFSKGNLRYESSKWSFFDNQYDYYTSYSADAWDHFGWSTSATDYGKNTSTVKSDYSGDFVDWGATMGTGWRMLTSDEWTYLLKTRSASTVGGTENGRYAKAKVNNVRGVILFPDTYTHPDGVTAPTGVNVTGDTGWNGNSYTAEDWTKMETAGCVFLPAAGYRNGSMVNNPGSVGDYSSATPSGTEKAYELYFSSGSLNTASEGSRYYGLSVRLVREVATSDAGAEAKEPATVTTAPTGAAVVGVGKTTALVSGGVAEGGTLMYQMTTVNTKPASTDGFSADVPTAESITASGKVYVWYYVKGDDTHSDSEIAATAIEVPVADIVWDVTNVTDLSVAGTGDSYEKEGITLSCNAENAYAVWADEGNPTTAGMEFTTFEYGGFTFRAPTGKAFTKIEMTLNGSGEWNEANLGTGWAFNAGTVTWKGTAAASTVDLLKDSDYFMGPTVKSIAFYLSE